MKRKIWLRAHLSEPHYGATSLSTTRSTGVISRVLGNRVRDQFWGVSGFPFTGLRGERSRDHSWSHTSEADTLNNWTLEGQSVIISHSNSNSCQTTPVTWGWHFVFSKVILTFPVAPGASPATPFWSSSDRQSWEAPMQSSSQGHAGQLFLPFPHCFHSPSLCKKLLQDYIGQ